VEVTRRRILEAAQAEFTDKGIDGTSMQAVARRADLAAGTVLYHFPEIDQLARAVIKHLFVQMELPTMAAIVDRPAGARVAALVEEMYRFYERTSHLYPFHEKNQHHPLVKEALADFERAVAELVQVTLGRRARSAVTAVVSALVDVSFYAHLTARRLTTRQAATAASALARASVAHPDSLTRSSDLDM
jgi:AcrR family transcriptional regulator